MASSFSFHLAVVLLLVLVHQHAGGTPDNFDLHEVLKKYVERESEYHKTEVVCWDFHCKPDDLKGHRLKRPTLTVTAGPVVYGATKSSTRRPNVVYSTWVHNGQASSSQQITVNRKTKHKKTVTWHVESGFSYSGSLTASVNFFKFVDIETKHQISLDLKGGYRQEESDTETFSVNQVVTVPPMKSVKIEWVITDAVQEVPWTSTVTVTGEIRIKFKERVNNSFFWSHGIGRLHDSRLKYKGDNIFQYTAGGTYTAVKGHDAQLRVTEHDYQAYGGRSSAVRTYTIPLSLTPNAPAAKTL
uniref:Putative salivary secreted peptide n=1 Tax=Ixodes ricinus TaxID=34613 RepID=A0A131Y730_IXORI